MDTFKLHMKVQNIFKSRFFHSRYGIYEMQGNEDLEDAYSKARIAREQARAHREQHYVFYNELDHERLEENQQLEDRFEDSLTRPVHSAV